MSEDSIEDILAAMDAEDTSSSNNRKRDKKNQASNGSSGLMGLIKKLALTAIVSVGGLYGYQEATMEDFQFTVTGTEIKQDKSCVALNGGAEKCDITDTDYLIHTNKGTFENETSIFRGKDAEDVINLQKKFQKGATYNAEGYGFDKELDGINLLDAERTNITLTDTLMDDIQGAVTEGIEKVEGIAEDIKIEYQIDPDNLKQMMKQMKP